MKALSLWQPWASLIALGEKHYETRSWATPYRGPLAIHAAKTWNAETRSAANDYDIALALERHGLHAAAGCPLGAVLATCRLVACHRMPEFGTEAWFELGISGDELAFGDFAPGRYAWELTGVVPLDAPVPARGAQGLWEWVQP